MNDKDWNDNDDFWDDADDDEDDYNDFGNDNIDANNDETFDNAAEWNEDEHEELIARDSILSQTNHRNNNERNSSNVRAINNNNLNQASSSEPNSNTTQNNKDLNDLLRTTLGNRNNGIPNIAASSSTNVQGDDIVPSNLVASILGLTSSSESYDVDMRLNSAPSSSQDRAFLAMLGDRDRTLGKHPNDPRHPMIHSDWEDSLNSVYRLREAQSQKQQLLLQQRDQEQLRRRIQLDDIQQQQKILNQHQQQIIQDDQWRQQQQVSSINFIRAMAQPQTPPKVLTVDELERQLLKTNISQQRPTTSQHQNQKAKPQPIGTPSQFQQQQRRAAWSPFVGKDIFESNNQEVRAQMERNSQIQLPPMSIEQESILLRHQIMQRQQQLLHLAMLEQQQQQQQQRLQQLQESKQPVTTSDQKLQCMTVEELERQMLADRSGKSDPITKENAEYASYKHSLMSHMQQKPAVPSVSNEQRDHQQSTSSARSQNHFQIEDRQLFGNQQRQKRNDERPEQNNSFISKSRDFDRGHHRHDRGSGREMTDNQNRRDNRRDYFKLHHKRETTIIPPQVQLSVINKTKSAHPLRSIQDDEYFIDRMPNSDGTIQSRKHSMVSNGKAKHDGVLTEQERNWLIKVQKKIQSECDERMDQDYYYLLYFNRSSMADEAANKPSGPSVLDKRFIPRERLLYNSSAV